MNRSVLCFAVATLLCFSGCRADSSGRWHEESNHRWRALSVSGEAGGGFAQAKARRTGVDAANRVGEALFLENRHYLNGSGVAIGDVDGDEWPDIYLTRLGAPNALYRNLGGWRFEDITERAGVGAADRFSTGAALADVDGDGDLDILITATGGPNAVFLNDGQGRFEETPDAFGALAPRGSATMALADTDGDGDLDLYVGNYKVRTVRDMYSPQERAFDRVVEQAGDAYRVRAPFEPHYVLRREGNRMMRFEIGEADGYYLNDGAGRFALQAFTEGAFLDEEGKPLQEAPRDWALTARFQDINGDGAPDLLVCNDFESPDHFWFGDGKGTFRAAPGRAFRKTSQSTMSVAISDIDRDGHMDIFQADMLSRDHRRRQRQQSGVHSFALPAPGNGEGRPQEMQNTLFLGRGDGTFAEVAHMAGVHASEWTWGSAFLDVDLDGWEDLLLATGHAYDAMDADARMAAAATPSGAAWREEVLLFPPLDLKNMAFRNRGDGTFEAMDDGWGLGREADVSHGLALGDLDRDGDLDVAIARLDRPAALFRNRSSASRVAVSLRGLAPNTRGVGAKVRLSGGGLPTQEKEIIAGGQYLSSSEALVSFAAGNAEDLRIEALWRSGRYSRIEGAHANRHYELFESAAARLAPRQPRPAPDPHFEEILLAHAHRDPSFDDFRLQPLLPWKLSREGPAAAWADLDGDGDDDLLIGSGRGGRMTWFRNAGAGRLDPPKPVGEAAFGDQTGVVVLERAGEGALVAVGVSGYEAGLSAASVVDIYRVRPDGAFERMQRLPFGASSVGALALGDLDGDGDVDIFAGGRHVPGRYPEAASSVAYWNEGGRFAYDERSEVFGRPGLVGGAAIGDLDADGAQDVILATEWGPVRVFRGLGQGAFEEVTAAWGLDRYEGWWQGVALGDFDGDGRLDIVATNRGWNTPYGRPERDGRDVRLYYGDYDLDNRMDMVEARYEEALGGYVPMRQLVALSAGLPLVRRRMRTFAQYSVSTVDEAIGPRLLRGARKRATWLASTVFLNKASGLEAHPLPAEAQRTAGFGVAVGDLDGDGNEDLFIGQNLSALPADQPRLDAGRGLWLRGDGNGGFAPVGGAASGITVYGAQRAVAAGDYDRDGRLDLLVTQNGAPARLFRNRRAAPGLRLRLLESGRPALGAVARLRHGEGAWGPSRLVSAGSGRLGQSSTTLTMAPGSAGKAGEAWVRWADGAETVRTIEPGTNRLTVSRP